MRLLLPFGGVLVVACLAACAAPTDDGSGESGDELIGGAPANASAAVYLGSGCSGARVGERLILTAGHCVLSDDGTLKADYAEGRVRYTNASSFTSGRDALKIAAVQHVAIDGVYDEVCRRGEGLCTRIANNPGADVAVIVTAEPLDPNIPIAQVDMDPVAAGQWLLMTGYGCEVRGQTSATKTFKAGYATAFDASSQLRDRYLRTRDRGSDHQAQSCPGDSGGPMFRGGAIVAVNSSSAQNESGSQSWHTRLDIVENLLRESGAQLCRSSEGTCTSEAPLWQSGKLTLLGKCITPVDGNDDGNGTTVELRPCTGSPREKWTPFSDGVLRHVASGRCLDLPAPTPGVRLHLWDCHGEPNQRFRNNATGNGIVVEAGGLCLDAWMASSDDGTPIVGWSCHGGANQQVAYVP